MYNTVDIVLYDSSSIKRRTVFGLFSAYCCLSYQHKNKVFFFLIVGISNT